MELPNQTSWYEPLRSLTSLGSNKNKIAHMGELAAARKIHLGQFFTPDLVAQFMWNFVKDLPIKRILDNSIGSGRLLQFACPVKHILYGVDVHESTVNKVIHVAEEAGFSCQIRVAGMQDIRPRNLDVSLINPPFSIHLESPNLEHFKDATTMGRFGPHSSAMSDRYALAQALNAAGIVIALMPRSRALELYESEFAQTAFRLRAIYHLPRGTFTEEGTEVQTSVMVYGEPRSEPNPKVINLLSFSDQIEDHHLGLALSSTHQRTPGLFYRKLEHSSPSIILPVTGDNTVGIHLDGRRIKLKFSCGLTQAKVMNAVLKKKVFSDEHHRLPAEIEYAGQGRLDLEAYLIQEDPMDAFMDFLKFIEEAGGEPKPHASVLPTVKCKIKRTKRALTPFNRVVWSKGTVNVDVVKGKAKQTHTINPKSWISPVVKQDEEIIFTKLETGTFSFKKNSGSYELTADELESKYVVDKASEGWQAVHAGKKIGNEQHARLLESKIKKLGIDKWLTWEFQTSDLVELLMQPSGYGAICGWEQALGKSRLGAALILLSGVKHGLMVLEARLVDEMLVQLAKLPIDQSQIHVIDNPLALGNLKTINLISYERLRMPVGASKSTYAKRLRRRIGMVVPDEAEKLANADSEQSRALFQLSAKRKFPMTGTPIANYPRDIHGMLRFVGGDATACQPYGYRRGYLSAVWLRTMEYVPRGLTKLAEDFVVMEWATHEFMETLSKGAKREVPKIQNLQAFRAWLAPFLKRRVVDEPEVMKHLSLPPVYEKVHTIEWDPHHLSHYLVCADDFAQWYQQDNEGKRHNLAMLLAKIQAVHRALNIPQEDGRGYKGGLTSKQKAVLQRLLEIAAEGKKALLFCNNPGVVSILHRELKRHKVSSIKFTGRQSINDRNKEKNDLFINGPVPHMLATLGCAKSGQNLPQADYVLFYDRCWSFRTQDQAAKRPRRVERKEAITLEFFHLPGSLDIYQDQMVAFKKDSTLAGLDWATPELDEVEFLHMATVLNRFVHDLAEMHLVSDSEMREQLKIAA